MNQKQQNRDILLRKNGKFFLIKNSHAQQNYKNHSYFNTSKFQKQTQSKLRQQLKNVKMDKQFVDGSTPFGVDNTYKYLWNKSDIKSRLRAQWKLRLQTQQSIYKKDKEYSNFSNYKLKPITDNENKNIIKAFNTRSQRIYTQAQNTAKSTFSKIQPFQKQVLSFPIELIYSSNIKTYDQIAKRTLQINFSYYLIKTFLKCKINWNKIDSIDFYQIVRIIQIARQYTNKIDFSAKDLVNMKNITQIFQYLANFKEKSNDWIATIRYFFIPPQKADQFILQQFKDQVKLLITSRLNIIFTQDNINFYDYETGNQLKSMFDLVLSKKIVFDSHFCDYQNLKFIIKKHKQQELFKERIQRWKSVVPSLSSSCESENKMRLSNKDRQGKNSKTFVTLNQSNYHKLYERYKIKHSKFLGKPKIRQYQSQKSQFIERQKLIKNYDIFQK